MNEWKTIDSAPENSIIWTKIDDEHGVRNEQRMIRKGRLWWFSDMSMYAYYTPTHWRPSNEPPK